jgi:hypothetical protein
MLLKMPCCREKRARDSAMSVATELVAIELVAIRTSEFVLKQSPGEEVTYCRWKSASKFLRGRRASYLVWEFE